VRLVALSLIVALAGCPSDGNPSGCELDSDCGGDVCARDGSCLPAAYVHLVKIRWTISGQPASATTCAATPDLYVNFYNSIESFGFAPVPCVQGQFVVDKLPTSYNQVELGAAHHFDQYAQIDSSGTVTFDLVP
jgi:hypothetical protein